MTSILVVDDEAVVTRILKIRLSSAGYEVDSACNGEEALEKLDGQRFDVLVTDICMPAMTGRELCEQVNERGFDPPLLIFVCTSRPEDEFRDWTRDIPGVEFMEKPVSLERLTKRIGERLNAGPGAEEPAP